MGLFFDVLRAINNPNQQASISHLETMTNAVQKVAGEHGVPANQMPTILSAVGSAVLPALQQKAGEGGNPLEQLMGGMLGNAALQSSVLPPQAQAQLVNGIAQKTGLNASVLQSMVPALIPVVTGFLSMGANKPGQPSGNPLLSAFLSGSQDGGSDLGNVLNFANRFLKPA
jgi:membrane-bound lytic murein transglycosylase B